MSNQAQLKTARFFSPNPTRNYPKGQILTYAGQDPDGIIYLLEGIIEQYDITPEGNKVTVNIFKPPAFFPMSWALNKTPNDYFFAALTDIKIKQTDAESAVAFLEANPDVTLDLLSRVYKGTDALLKKLVFAARGEAASRLMFELLIESYRFGEKISSSEIVITIKQHSLAARSGLARETVSRILHKLETEGLLKQTRQGMVVNYKKLEKKLDSVF